MQKSITTLLIALLFLGGTTLATAQDLPMGQQPAEPVNVSDEELEDWVEVFMGFQQLQQQLQPQFLQKIEEAGLEVEKFQEIMQSEQMGAAREDIEATNEQMAAYDEAINDIEETEEAAYDDFFEDENINLERFEEIYMALSQDPELMEKAEEMIMEAQGMPQGQRQAPPH